MPNYKCIIKAHWLAESKEKHTPSVRFSVHAHFNMNDNVTMDKDFTIDLWLSENAATRTMTTLRKLGFNGDSLEMLNGTDALVDVPCELTTEWVEYNNRSIERAVFLNEDGAKEKFGIKALDGDSSRRVCGRYDAMLRNTAKVAKAKKVEKIEKKAEQPNPYSREAQLINQLGAEPVADTADDEDLPF